jgi:hypothetical protein
MGFFDFLTGGGESQVKRHAKTMMNRDAQPDDRQRSAEWLFENGSDEAIQALCNRFKFTTENHMKDVDEKELVYGYLVDLGPKAVGPVREFMLKNVQFTYPLRVVEHFEGKEKAVDVMLEMLENEKDPFKPEKKRQILLRLADFHDARARDALVRELQDFDEGIRYAAAEALLGIDDPMVREPLAQALAKSSEESNRLRVRIAEAFHQRSWPLGEHAAAVAQRPPTGFVVQGDRVQRA